MNQELSANISLSHDRITARLGAGGMGEIYLAEDTKLDRKGAGFIRPQDDDITFVVLRIKSAIHTQ
jgi:hypothetical protein